MNVILGGAKGMNDNEKPNDRGSSILEIGLVTSLIAVAIVGVIFTVGQTPEVKTYVGKILDYVQNKYAAE